jgi:hypothetical protein
MLNVKYILEMIVLIFCEWMKITLLDVAGMGLER